MPYLAALMVASVLTLSTTAQCYALASWFPFDNNHPKVSRSTPGPIIGVGGSAALVAGGYIWFRYRSKRK